MRLTEAVILAVDTETTGTDPEQARIVELGGAYFRGGAVYGKLVRDLVNPGIYIPAGASVVHGIKSEDVESAPPWTEIAARFARHLDAGPVLCGYNFAFYDARVIAAENARHGVEWALPEALDPFVFACWHHRGERSRKLINVCALYGIGLPEDRAHSADADALATGALLLAMVRAGCIPDDVEAAFAEQARLRAVLDGEEALYGRYLYPDRGDERLRVGLGKHAGTLLEDVDEEYLRWLGGRPDLPDATRLAVNRRLGRIEQVSLF
ncbi:MAG: 3'-5' exonuclease [Myxococcales bacterium]|nr:3'-5' exonuclease [Myxococcales bacterium]MCB9535275.1 3'-5' exonuclease [Myxococcales bacterium]